MIYDHNLISVCHCTSSLQAGRGHIKQLMRDMEEEQERAAGLNDELGKVRGVLDEAVATREVAEARVHTLQDQLGKANDSSAVLTQRLEQACAAAQVGGAVCRRCCSAGSRAVIIQHVPSA